MGADRDTEIAFGEDAEQAFRAIAEERAYDYGHAGYTGTFAETPGVVLLGTLPARMTWEKFEEALERQNDLDYQGYWIEHKYGEDEHGCRVKVKEAKRTRSPWPKPMQTPVWKYTIRRFIDQSDTKWEAAAAMRLNVQQERDYRKRSSKAGTRDRAYYMAAMCSS